MGEEVDDGYGDDGTDEDGESHPSRRAAVARSAAVQMEREAGALRGPGSNRRGGTPGRGRLRCGAISGGIGRHRE